MEAKRKVMKKVNNMMIQMITTNRMFSINRMHLDLMFLIIKSDKVNLKKHLLLDNLDNLHLQIVKLHSLQKRKYNFMNLDQCLDFQ